MNFSIGNSKATMRYSENFSARHGGNNGTGKNSTTTQKILFSKTICPFCNMTIAIGNRDVVKTENGLAHYRSCALPRAMKILQNSGLPRPTEFSTPESMQRFFRQKTNDLLEKPASPAVENQLATILEVAEKFFNYPIRISAMIAR